MLYLVHTVQYLRLMVIWTITTAFSGVYQSLAWLEHSSGSETENNLVRTLLVLSIGGVIGNVRSETVVSSRSDVEARARSFALPAVYISIVAE